MENRIVLITGATSGIGKAASIELAKQNFTVILHGRNKKKAQEVCNEIKTLTGNQKIDIITADFFLMSDIRKMAKEFKQKYDRLDVLINNAGGIMGVNRENTSEGIEKTIALNLFAPFLLTSLLWDMLKKSPDARIINVSSNSHSLNAKPDFTDLQLEKNYDPLKAYGNSKLFLIWISQQLAFKLNQQAILNLTVNTMHPGAVASNFGVDSNLGSILNFIGKLVRPLFKTVEQGADTIVYLASSNDVEGISGKYFVNRKQSKVTEKYYTVNCERFIWNYCQEQTDKS